MLPVVKGENVTRNHILGYCISLIFNSALIVIYGNTGLIFLISGFGLSIYFTYMAYNLTKTESENDAWALFKFSNVYLFALFIFLVLDASYIIES